MIYVQLCSGARFARVAKIGHYGTCNQGQINVLFFKIGSLYFFFLFPAGVVSVPAAAASLVFVLSGGCQQPVLCAWSGAVVLMSVTLVWFKDQ